VPDWKEEISKELASLKLAPTREAEIIEELSQHLDDRYDELVSGGLTKEEAYREALVELSESNLLARQLQRVERAVAPEPVNLGGNGAGSMVTGLQNSITGKMVDITLHPWLPHGNMPIISWTLPVPNSNVSECWQVRSPQDLIQYNWPVNEFRFQASTYWFSTLIPYAPMYSGMVSSSA